MNAPVAAPEISRRRVLQSTAWATPALLIATAVPAAAASGEVRALGAIAQPTPTGFQSTTQFTVNTLAVFVGASTAYPITDVKVRIAVPSARAGAGNGTTASSGWAFDARDTSVSGVVTFVYRWTGAALSSTNNATSPLVAVIPKAATRIPLNLSVQSVGVSNFLAVQSTVASASIAAHSLLTFGNAFAVDRDPWLSSPRYIRTTATIRNNIGGTTTNTAPIVGLVARITVPTSAVGSGTPGVDGGSWSYTSAVTSGSNRIFTFTYTGGSLPASASSVTANFRIPMVGTLWSTPTISAVFEGYSPTAATALTSISASATLSL